MIISLSLLIYDGTLDLCSSARSLLLDLLALCLKTNSCLTAFRKASHSTGACPNCNRMYHQLSASPFRKALPNAIFVFSPSSNFGFPSTKSFRYVSTWYDQVIIVSALRRPSKGSADWAFSIQCFNILFLIKLY